jgi:hypothetical protein
MNDDEPVYEEIKDFLVTVFRNEDDVSFFRSTDLFWELTGLESNTDYTASVKAVTVSNRESESISTTFKTKKQPELVSLRVININETSAHVDWEWNDMGDEYEKIAYFIFYWGTGNQTGSGETHEKRVKEYSVDMENLHPGTLYKVYVRAVTAPGLMVEGIGDNFETAKAVPQPSNLTVSNFTHTSSVMSWDMKDTDSTYERVQEYFVQIKLLGEDAENDTQVGKWSTSEQTWRLNELHPSEAYEVSVMAVTESGRPSEVISKKFVTKSIGKPITMEAVRETKDSLFITWTPSKGHGLTSYDLEVKVMDDDSDFRKTVAVANVDPDQTNFTVSGLPSDNTYQSSVTPVYDTYLAKEIGAIAVTAFKATPQIANLDFVDILHQSARAEWNSEDVDMDKYDAVKHYHWSFTKTDDANVEETSGNSKYQFVDMEDLEQNTTYNFQVVAVTAFDESEAVSGEFETHSTGSVSLTVDEVTPYSLHVTWNETDGDGLTGFTLTYTPVFDMAKGSAPDSEVVSMILDSRAEEQTLPDLQPSTVYDVEVTPMYGILRGVPAQIRRTTGKLTPRPVEIEVSNITHTSAKISWYFTDDDGEDMDSFWVKYAMIFDEDYYQDYDDDMRYSDLTHVEDDHFITLLNLEPNSQYEMHLYTDDAINNEFENGKINFTTLAMGYAHLELANATQSSFTAKMATIGGEGLSGYKLWYGSEDLSMENEKWVPASDNDEKVVLVSGLTPGSKYTAFVEPVYSEVWQADDLYGLPDDGNIRTVGLAPRIKNVTVSDITKTGAHATWVMHDVDDTYDDVLYYEVALDGGTSLKVPAGDELEVDFADLEPFSQHDVTVTVMATDPTTEDGAVSGESLPYTKYFVTKKRTPEVTGPFVDQVSHTRARVKWSMFDQGAEFDEIFQYKVDYKDLDTDADALSLFVTPSGIIFSSKILSIRRILKLLTV